MYAYVLLLFLPLASSHVCILDPPQRGNLSVQTPGDPSCYRRTIEACTDIKPSSQSAGQTFVVDQLTTVHVQQNLNHWVSPTNDHTSGYFELKLLSTNGQNDVLLDTWSDFPAWDEVSQTNFTRKITIPSGTTLGPQLLIFSYVSYNRDEVDPPTNLDAVFYNCADIVVVDSATAKIAQKDPNGLKEEITPSLKKKVSTTADVYNCTTPDKWSAKGVETTSNGDFIQHYIVVDNIQQQMFWSRKSSNPTVLSFPSVTTITNFTSGREYVLTESGNKCAIYGPDAFYRLSFGGPSTGMTGGVQIRGGGGDGAGSVYGFHGYPINNGITWTTMTTKENYCLPLSRVTPSSSLQWIESTTLNAIPTGQFDEPSVCKSLSKQLTAGRIKGCGFVE
jgi:hypothetical protein